MLDAKIVSETTPLSAAGASPNRRGSRNVTIRRDHVANRMKELGISALDVARRGRLEKTFVSDLLEGRKAAIRDRNLGRLAMALETDPEELTVPTPASEVLASPASRRARALAQAPALPASEPVKVLRVRCEPDGTTVATLQVEIRFKPTLSIA